MSPFDLGWIVGLLEGEGCFNVYIDKRRPSTCTVKIQVESTDKDVVDRLNGLVPGNVVEHNYPSKFERFPNAKDSWRWTVSTKKQVKELGELVFPHMSARRQERIKEVLSYCEYKKERNNG